jgi:hypothetical protein
MSAVDAILPMGVHVFALIASTGVRVYPVSPRHRTAHFLLFRTPLCSVPS